MKIDKPNKSEDKHDNNSGWVNYLGLGTQLAVTVTGMTFLGVWLDKKFNTVPILTLVCAFLGITAGIYNFIKTALKSR